MVLLSTLRQQSPSLNLGRLLKLNSQPAIILKRHSGHGHNLDIKPSNFNFKKSKDLWHFYTCVALLIYGPLILYANVFHGEAILVEIPEGYRPKHWEYYKHPVTRYLQSRFQDPQENYEKYLQFLYEEDEKVKLRQLDDQVNRVMKRRKDYQAHYYLPLTNPANVMREEKEQGDRIQYHNVDTLMSEGFPADLGDRDSDLTDHFDDYKGGEDM